MDTRDELVRVLSLKMYVYQSGIKERKVAVDTEGKVLGPHFWGRAHMGTLEPSVNIS